MANRQRVRYGKKHHIHVLARERADGAGWTPEFSIEEHGTDIVETMFYPGETFPTSQAAIKAGIAIGRYKIDSGFQAVVSRT